MSTRVTRAELLQLQTELQYRNAEIAFEKKKKDEEARAQKRAIIDSILPAVCTAIDAALRYRITENLTNCTLRINKDLEIINDGCRASCIEYDGNKNDAFVSFCDEVGYFGEILKKEYDIWLSVDSLYGERIVMRFNWKEENAQSAHKRARTDNE